MHLHGPTQNNKRKTHLKKQNFMFNKKEQFFHSHLFSRESKRWIIISGGGVGALGK
jgi:hypothetical protein